MEGNVQCNKHPPFGQWENYSGPSVNGVGMGSGMRGSQPSGCHNLYGRTRLTLQSGHLRKTTSPSSHTRKIKTTHIQIHFNKLQMHLKKGLLCFLSIFGLK